MMIHKKTRLTPVQRKSVADDYFINHIRKKDLAVKYLVSRPVIDKILLRAHDGDYSVHNSTNQRFRCLQYGLKRLTKIEKRLEDKLKKEAQRYNKKYPGEMVHVDTKRLPLLSGETKLATREYLFVGIDDFSRELFATIMPDKTQHSSKQFLEQVLDECPYTIEQIYSDNGLEYRGNSEHHAFMQLCQYNNI